MNTIFDIEKSLVDRMEHAAKSAGRTRDAALKEAIEDWLAFQPKQSRWLETLQNIPGDPDFLHFEIDRPGSEALPPDPFGDSR